MMTKEIVIERYGPLQLHDGQRRLGGLDAAAPAGRELSRAARRPHHQPGLRGPLDAGAGLARLPRADALLLADEPAHEPRPRVGAGQPAVPDRRGAAARVGLQPEQPGQPVRPEGAGVRRRPHGAGPDRERRLRAAARAAVEPGDESDRRALRDRRLHARDLRRHRHARRARTARASWPSTTSASSTACARCRAGRSRPSSSSTSTARSAGWTSTATSSPERTVADPDALRIAYETGRVNSATGAAKIPEIDNRTGAQMDDTGFHPAFHSFSYRARLDRSNGNHDNQVIWLSRTGGVVPNQFDAMRRGWTPASKPAEAKDACFMANGVQGDLTCNGTWQYYGTPAPRRRLAVHARRRQVPAQAAGARRLRRSRSRTSSGRRCRRRSRRASATTPKPGVEPAAAEGAVADVRRRPGRAAAGQRSGGGRDRPRQRRRHGAGDALALGRAGVLRGVHARASRRSTRRRRPPPSPPPPVTRRSRSPTPATSPTARSPCPSRCGSSCRRRPGRRRSPTTPVAVTFRAAHQVHRRAAHRHLLARP